MSKVVPIHRTAQRRPPRHRPTNSPPPRTAPPRLPSRGAAQASRASIATRIFSTWLLGKLLALAVLAGCGWLAFQAFVSPQFRLTTTSIRGTELVSTDEILYALPSEGTNIFTVRTTRVAKTLETIPAIERADVTLSLPSTIRVMLHERRAAAAWETEGRDLLITSDGLVLANIAELSPGSSLLASAGALPRIYAPEGPSVAPGDRVDGDVIALAGVIAPRLSDIGLPSARVEYHPSSGVTLALPGSYQIVLGNGDNLEAKLKAFEAIRGHLEQTHAVAQVIDVRFLERPYYR